MANTVDSEFGKEVGLVHKMIVTGRKVGAGKEFYTVLADHEDIFREVVEFVMNSKSRFLIWKTIKLGTGLRTPDEFRGALKSNGFRISQRADDLIRQSKFSVAPKKTRVCLVVVSLAELGFPNGAKHRDIYIRARELGLELCPAEVGPQLRLQYKDQSEREWLLIAMEPITDSFGHLDAFRVGRVGGDLWLDANHAVTEDFWLGGSHWVFVGS